MRSGNSALVGLILGLVTACSSAKGPGSAAISITATVDDSGVVKVAETFVISSESPGALPPLSRRFWVNPATFPLRQQVVNLRVHDGDGNALRYRRRAYGDWINVDLLDIPHKAVATVVLEYEIKRGLVLSGDTARLKWALVGMFWNIPVTSLELAVSLPAETDPAKVSHTTELDYEQYKGPKPTIRDGVFRWKMTKLIGRDKTLEWTLTFPRGNISAPGGYGADLVASAGIVFWGLIVLIVFALVLLFLPARLAIAVTPVFNATTVATGLFALGENARYWLFEARYRGKGELDNVLVEQVMFIGFVVILVGIAVAQHRALRAGKRSAYFSQLALPVALALPLPMFSTNPMLLFTPLLGLPVLIFWRRREIALHFGAGMHRLLEHVTTEGQVAFSALAGKLELGEKQLARLLNERPGLPIVVDFDSRVVYSPAAAALRRDFLICSTCGAGTEVKGMDMAACAHCGREYAASRKAKPTKPIPVVVDGIAAVLHMFGSFFVVWGGLLLGAFLLLSLFDGADGIVIAIVAGVVVAGPGVALIGQSHDMRDGKRSGLVSFALLVTAPLVIPWLAYRALDKKRVQLFFGTYDPKTVGKEIKAKGELSLAALAEMLETDVAEAAEVARYLAGNGIVDAVFDRDGNRLVSRKAYRDLAAEGACKNCGGVLGVIGGRAACHHCGEAA